MVLVRKLPYLEHQLCFFARQSLRDIVILTGYLGHQIEDYFEDGARLGLRIRYSRESEPLGTAGALREAEHLLDDAFLVVYGDSFLPIDYTAVGRRLLESDATGLIVAYRDSAGETSVRPNVALGADGYVSRYDKHAIEDPELEYIEAGVSAFRRSVLGLVPAQGVVSLEQQVYPQLISQRALLGVATKQRFYDIGTPERLCMIEDFFARFL